MIKRISQKSRRDFLDAKEIEGLTLSQLTGLLDPRRSWVLFTSTELLRAYLKEAFGKEGLPASSATVRTWDDQRMQLARDVFRFVRVGGRGRFKHTKSVLLNPDTGVGSKDYESLFRAFVSRARVIVPESIRTGLQARLDLHGDAPSRARWLLKHRVVGPHMVPQSGTHGALPDSSPRD